MSREAYLRSINFYGSLPNKTPIGSPAHLIIGLRVPIYYEHALGALLDTDTRGVAAIFTDAPELREGNPDLLLRVCAHEIGHMLNLIHSQGHKGIPTTMCPAEDREHEANSPELAWQKMEIYSADEWKKKLYPFSKRSNDFVMQALKKNTKEKILPWGGPFKIEEDYLRVSSDYSCNLKMIPERDEFYAGEHFGFICELSNTSNQDRIVPGILKPEFSSLILRTTRPDDTVYFHRPRSIVCSNWTQTLESGGKKFQPILITDGPGYSIFPFPGLYTIEAIVPGTSVPEKIEIQVNPTKNDKYLSKEFLRSLKNGTHTYRWRQRKFLNEIINTGDINQDPHVAYLALLKASRLRQYEPKAHLFEQVQNSASAPLLLKHLATAQRCLMARNKPALFDKLLKQAFETFPDKKKNECLHNMLNGIVKNIKGGKYDTFSFI